MTQADALAAMAAVQRTVERRKLVGNEGPLDALMAAVVLALRADDFAAVVEGCGHLIRTAEAMPPGEFVWPKPRQAFPIEYYNSIGCDDLFSVYYPQR